MPIEFALGDVEQSTDEWVYRKGKIFQAGNYPDKKFAMDEAGLDAAIAGFESCPVDLEHTSTPLDGKLGHVKQIWREGKDLFGEVALPLWLDRALEGSGRKVSATWERTTNRLQKLALVNDPRVPDAALMSAYTAFSKRHDTPQGQQAMQELHDVCARRGAVCKAPAHMSSRHEATAVQNMHDMSIEHGAQCAAMSTTTLPGSQAWYSKNPPPNGGTKPMPKKSFKDWFAAGREVRDLARDHGAEIEDEVTFGTVEEQAEAVRTQVRAEEEAKFAGRQAEADRLLAEAKEALFKAEAQRMQGEATGYVQGLIDSNKLFPALRESFISLMVQASLDDARSGPATFSTGGATSRIEQFKAACAAMPEHTLTKEQIAEAAKGGKVLFNTTETKDLKPNEADYSVEELLGKTDAGRTAITLKNGRG